MTGFRVWMGWALVAASLVLLYDFIGDHLQWMVKPELHWPLHVASGIVVLLCIAAIIFVKEFPFKLNELAWKRAALAVGISAFFIFAAFNPNKDCKIRGSGKSTRVECINPNAD
jgi:membrane protein YdbS with pleckstrin-like domain